MASFVALITAVKIIAVSMPWYIPTAVMAYLAGWFAVQALIHFSHVHGIDEGMPTEFEMEVFRHWSIMESPSR